ncbi:tetratricopeptide repeat protein [Fulvivirgaceae bacterium PWU4]|uniref:Tetratricopeptide repeat protein n=1 Tax=Chryseosolibacter histidini TaxID=2782349 RepID=A0AAP2DRT5_9BACT|nr:tetratricopeptide repeat protein [Chryseosolibacter histidini]MBT1701385.1 tetratricopeptide repeat protein [Chryseosolibacter histidini]
MAKIIQFSANPAPEKFGPQRARTKKGEEGVKPNQLNLFTGGKIVKLNHLSPFEEALLTDDHDDKRSARLLYQKAIEAGDSVADAYCNLGILESQEGNNSKAIDCFTMCLKHQPRHYEAHYNLANLFAEAGNYALAKLHYEISIEIEPSFSNCYYNLGLTLALNKQYKEAIEVLTKYRELTPTEDHKQTDDLIFKLSGLL